jgi:hypothetical protein
MEDQSAEGPEALIDPYCEKFKNVFGAMAHMLPRLDELAELNCGTNPSYTVLKGLSCHRVFTLALAARKLHKNNIFLL